MKDHVSRKSRRISNVLKSKFGWDLNDFNHALTGDVEALKKLGSANREAQMVEELLPMIKEAYLTIYGTTEEYNRAIADIIKQGGNSAIAIDKASMSATLDNTKYGNSRSQMAAEFTAAKGLERQRFNHAINYIKMKAVIDSTMAGVDNKATIEGQVNRPQLKQITTDLAHEAQVRKHVFELGDHERRGLLPTKDYEGATSGFLGRIKSALGLGV